MQSQACWADALIVRLANEHAVHVCAESRRRPWPACIKHRHRARIALGLVQEGLRHAVLKSTDHAVLHELRIPSENLRLIDVGLPDRDWKARFLRKLTTKYVVSNSVQPSSGRLCSSRRLRTISS